jgi:CheY-like chemotaxis protein
MNQYQQSILIIEDDRDIRDVLSELLQLEGYRVYVAEHGQEGLNFLKTSKQLPDLILLDVMMPVMDGYQFLKEQNLDIKLKEIPVVVMSADVSAQKRLASAKIAEFMKKPVDLDHVLSTVAKNFSNKEKSFGTNLDFNH